MSEPNFACSPAIVCSALSIVVMADKALVCDATVTELIDSHVEPESRKLSYIVSPVVLPAWMVIPVNEPSISFTSLKVV